MKITDTAEARSYAESIGYDFENQDDYCEICAAYHVPDGHEQDVSVECGDVHMAGWSNVHGCRREPQHQGEHRDESSQWPAIETGVDA